jgi:mRNA interferase MazF
MLRGEIWWTDFGDPRGSEPGYVRPAVVISSDHFNKTRLRTVTVVACTSNLALGTRPGNVVLLSRQTALPQDTVAHVTQLFTIDRDDLQSFIGILPPSLMAQIDTGLRLALGL